MKTNFLRHRPASARPLMVAFVRFRIRYVIIITFCCSLLTSLIHAQAPTVTADIGIPSGNGNARGVAYGNGYYITILGNGSVYRSADGENWERINDPGLSAGNFNRISFGASLFVIVGNSGLILTSPDGSSWTTRSSGTSNRLYHVAYLQSAFYATGQNRTLLTSTDGISWTTVGINTGTATDYLMSICYGNGAFVISSRPVSGAGLLVYRSTTGAANSWTFSNVAFATLNKIEFLNNKFFMFCSNTHVYTSPDGVSWTNATASLPLTLPNATVQTIGSPNQTFNGFYDGTYYFLFGSSQYHSGYGSIFYSTDGINFTLAPKTAYIVCQYSAFINGKYFQCGNEGIISSDDGFNYSYPGGTFYGMANSSSSYVGVGYIGNNGLIYTSSDFQTWTNTTPGIIPELNTVTYDGSTYFAAGNEVVLSSTDQGVTWSTYATPSFYFAALLYGSGKFINAGYSTSPYVSQIQYSADALNWTTANTDDNWYFKLKQENGEFFALGMSNVSWEGVILQSPDGITWTDVTPALSFPVAYYNDVVFDGTNYFFMGVEYEDLISYAYKGFFSIASPTPSIPGSYINKGAIVSIPPGIEPGGTWGEGAFAYSNGHFAGSVVDMTTGEGYGVYSSNGIDWNMVAFEGQVAMYGIAAQGNDFRMLGSSNGQVVMSFSGTTLPVSWNYFTASRKEQQVQLDWETTAEWNARLFQVQHSTDADHWTTIGSLNARGRLQQSASYQFVDVAPADGINYYRIKQVDVDGQQSYSRIEQVKFGQQQRLRIFPNPATHFVQIQAPEKKPGLILLYTANGVPVLRQPINNGSGQITMDHLPAGMYRLVVIQSGNRYSELIMRQ